MRERDAANQTSSSSSNSSSVVDVHFQLKTSSQESSLDEQEKAHLKHTKAKQNGLDTNVNSVTFNEQISKVVVRKPSEVSPSSAHNSFHWRRLLRKRVPIVDWLPKYKSQYLFTDMVAGFTIGIMNIPQCLSYALLASVEPVIGLYTSFFPAVAYTVLGSCRHLNLGAIGIVSLLSGAIVEKTASEYFAMQTDSSNSTVQLHQGVEKQMQHASIASSLSFLVGLIQFLMGLFGLGILSSYFSDTFISSFTCASAFHVVVSQIKELFGLRNLVRYDGIFKVPKNFKEIFLKIGNTNVVNLLISSICIIFLVFCKEFLNSRWKKRVNVEFPSELLLIIAITFLSYFYDFNGLYDISILKKIPKGIPQPGIPDINLFPYLLKDAFIVAIISFSISISLASLFSRKRKYNIDSSQELYALGAANMCASFFSCWPSAGSLSRSNLLDSIGSHTQLSSLFNSLVIVVVILWIGPWFEKLPKLCLASIVIVSLKSFVFHIKDPFVLWKVNKFEAFTWIVTFLGVVMLDIDIGLAIGISTSILTPFIRDQLFSTRTVRKIDYYRNSDNQHLLKDSDANLQNTIEPADLLYNVVIIKVEQSLNFSNSDTFQNKLFKAYGFSPIDERKAMQPESRATLISLNKEPDLILDFSAVNYIDTNGMKKLQQIIEDFQRINVFVCVCNCQEHFIDMLSAMKMSFKMDKHLFSTIDNGLAYLNTRKNENVQF